MLMQTDIFRIMLALSLKENIDLGKLISYSLTSIPMSLYHTGGTMLKIDKPVVIKMLEEKIIIQPPKNVDVKILVCFFLTKYVPKTFGAISNKYLQMVIYTSALMVDIIF